MHLWLETDIYARIVHKYSNCMVIYRKYIKLCQNRGWPNHWLHENPNLVISAIVPHIFFSRISGILVEKIFKNLRTCIMFTFYVKLNPQKVLITIITNFWKNIGWPCTGDRHGRVLAPWVAEGEKTGLMGQVSFLLLLIPKVDEYELPTFNSNITYTSTSNND